MLSCDPSSFDPDIFLEFEKLPEPKVEEESGETTSKDCETVEPLIQCETEVNVVESSIVRDSPCLSINIQSSDDFKTFSQSVSYHFLSPNVRLLGKQNNSNETPFKKGIVPILKKVRVLKRLIHSTPNLNVYSIESNPNDVVTSPNAECNWNLNDYVG